MSIRRVHDRIEAGFEAWGRIVVRWRWLVALAGFGLTVVLGSWLPHLRSDNSVESFLRATDPARIDYDRFRRQFGQDDFILVAVRPREVFDLGFLERLRALHEAVESDVPYVEEVTSLWNARNTRGEGDELVVEDLLETWPRTGEDLERLRARVLETPWYENTLVNRAGTLTTLTIKPVMYSSAVAGDEDALAGFEEEGGDVASLPFLTEAEASALVEGVMAVVERFDAPDFRLHLTGGYVGNHHSTRMMMRDIQTFLSVSIGVTALLLYVLFRRLDAVVLPLLTVLCSLVSTFGVMVMIDIPASISGQIMPPLLLTVGICGAVHLLVLVYRRLSQGGSREDAIVYALGHSGLAILMASLTTAAGLLSFSTAALAQVGDLGAVAPIGVMMSFAFVIGMLPALLAILPIRARSSENSEVLRRALGAALARVGQLSTRRPRAVLLGTLAVCGVAAVGFAQLRFSQFPVQWFPEHDPVRLASELVDAELEGSNTLEILLDTGRENGLHDPSTLNRIQEAMDFADAYDDGAISVGKVFSLIDVLKETHKALNENRHEFYTIPQDRRLVAQELLLFENSGSDDLEDLTDSRFQVARVSLRMPMVDDLHVPGFVAAMEAGFAERVGEGVSVEATGLGMLFGRTFSVINVTMARSYLLALGIITPLMVLLIGNLRQGLVAMVPNLLPIFLTLSLMGALGIAIDNSTLLVGCIIIGLAVDDTIHFMHKFQHYYARTGDPAEAVRLTLETTGSALMFTSLVLASGFLVMTLAYMNNIRDFGILASFATIVAFLSDVIVAPALMVLISPRREPVGAASAWPAGDPAETAA